MCSSPHHEVRRKWANNSHETIDADAMIHFFKELEEESKAVNIHIILDNARAHMNHKLDAYLKTSKIRLHYLPPYSPNLNSIERLWKVFRETALYNRFFPTCWDFFAAVRAFFADKIYQMKRFLTQRISDNFQTIQLNPIHLA